MRLRNITGSKEMIAKNRFVVHEPEKYKGCWHEEIFKNILDVSQLLEKYEIKVDKIYFDDDYNVTLYFDQARVKLGSFDYIDEKIIRLKAILPELKGRKGVLKLQNYTVETEYASFEEDE